VVGVHAGILRPTDFAMPYAIPALKIKNLQLHETVPLAEELAMQGTLCPKLAKISVLKSEVELRGPLSRGKILLDREPQLPDDLAERIGKLKLDLQPQMPDTQILHYLQQPLPGSQLSKIPVFDPSPYIPYRLPANLTLPDFQHPTIPVEWLQPSTKKRNWFFLEVATTPPKPTIGSKFFWVTEEDEARFYIGVKSTWNRRPKTNDLTDNMSFNEAENIFQDNLVAKKEGWTSVDLGVTGLANRHMAFYGGIGFKWFWNAKQYYDESQTLGNQGYYWIHENGDKRYLNAGWLFIVAQRICLDIGFDTKPFRFNLGAGFSLGSIF
jgi:hypothetical protein